MTDDESDIEYSYRYIQIDSIVSTSLSLSEFNMALLKAASQSETLWNYDPNLAVDGDANTCSFTPQSDVQRWWQVSDFFCSSFSIGAGNSREVYL